MVHALRLALLASYLGAQPLPITGLAGVTYQAGNLSRSRDFYRVMLGLPEVHALPDHDGNIVIVFLQINDMQYVELGRRAINSPSAPLLTLGTPNASLLREQLRKRGVNATSIQPTYDGNLRFHIVDPDGNALDCVEYQPNSQQVLSRGHFDGAPRAVHHLRRASLPVRNIQTALAFYRDRLGWPEITRATAPDGVVTAVQLQIPGEGHESLELVTTPAARAVAFDCDDPQQTFEALTAAGETLKVRPEKSATGVVTLRDPDGNRLEFQAEPVH